MAHKINLSAPREGSSTYDRLTTYLALFSTVVILALGALYGVQRRNARQEQHAQEELWPIVYMVEDKEYDKALEGNGIHLGLRALTVAYPHTKAAQQAYLYMGMIHMEQGHYEEAIAAFGSFSLKDTFLWGRAQEGMGNAYVALGKEEQALACYEQALGHKPNKYFTPSVYYKIAMLHEHRGDLEQALEIYEKIAQTYPDAPSITEALQHAARLRARKQRMPTPLD